MNKCQYDLIKRPYLLVCRNLNHRYILNKSILCMVYVIDRPTNSINIAKVGFFFKCSFVINLGLRDRRISNHGYIFNVENIFIFGHIYIPPKQRKFVRVLHLHHTTILQIDHFFTEVSPCKCPYYQM